MNRQSEQSATPSSASRRSGSRGARSELAQIALLILLITAARSSLANHFHVPSSSMEHSLLPGDRVVVDMTAYGIAIPFTETDLVAVGEPGAGDIAVFDSPLDGVRLIKRVVAVAGDEVSLVDGRLSINGRALRAMNDADVELFGERRVHLNLAHGGGPDIHRLTIPEGQVLALGDARGNSVDGRYFGLVDVDRLHGRATAVYYRRGEGLVWKQL